MEAAISRTIRVGEQKQVKEQKPKKAQWAAEGRFTLCGWAPPYSQDQPDYCPECGLPLSPQKGIPDSCS